MDYVMRMTPLPDTGNQIKAIGTMTMAEVTVRNILLLERHDGQLFLMMPKRDTGRVDKDGNPIREEIAHPITKEFRDAMERAGIDSYLEGHPITFSDGKDGQIEVSAECYDRPFKSIVGKGQLVVNEVFVIKNIFIMQNAKGEEYAMLPNYKTNKVLSNGKPEYSTMISMPESFKKRVLEAMVDEFHSAKAAKEQNRMTIKSRIKEAKKATEAQETKPVNKHKQEVIE